MTIKLFDEQQKRENYQLAQDLIELMDEEAQLGALTDLLARAHSSGDEQTAKQLYSLLNQHVEKFPHLKLQLLERLIRHYEFALAQHYREDIEKIIAAMDDEGRRLYYRAMQFSPEREVSEGRHKAVTAMVPQVLALADQGRRAIIMIMLANALLPNS